MSTADDRRDELAGRWADVQARVAAACRQSGRDPAQITVIAVTKTFPADDIARLGELGVRDVGENRDQEAAGKAAACRDLGMTGMRWHFVGQLQTNKARSVTGYADVVHSVDRVRLVHALDRAAGEHGRRVECLVQVDLDPAEPDDGGFAAVGTNASVVSGGMPPRGGVAPAGADEVCAAVMAAEQLDLTGLMAVAPREGEPDEAFARLATLWGELKASYPSLVILSAGMSDDLEAAVAHGATHLRVGRALLGSRPPLG